MTEAPNGRKNFVFGDFRLESQPRTLWRDRKEIHLAKRPFEILLFLIENRERVVSRDELLEKFWDGCDVYDDALRKTVGTIRHALNDTKKPPHFIETRYGSGFRFIGTVFENAGENGRNGVIESRGAEIKSETSNLQSGIAEDQNQKTKDYNKRYVLIAVLAAGALFFASLGFFVYFPNDKENLALRNSLVQTDAPVRSIAILPLKNLTGDAGNEYFSDGVTENLITELSRVDELRIISRGSTFALKDKEVDPREIGRKLSVDALLEGSVQKKGEAVSISVRLVSAADGSVLWASQNFERSAENAYELQDAIACNVAKELRAKFCDGATKHNTANADAYQAYLKGRYYWNKRTGVGIRRSIEFYEQAIGLDANYALAYAGLAESYLQGIWHVPFAARDALPKAKTAALKALELDDTLAEAHTALGNVYELEWKWSDGMREIARAIELNPRYARAYHVQAFCFSILGRHAEAVAAIERARELDPLNLVINTDKAMIFFAANRDEEAFRQWQKTLELDPNFTMAREHLGVAYEVAGNEAAAIEERAKVMELRDDTPEKIASFRQTASKQGLKEIYRKELKAGLAKKARGEYVSPVYLAFFYVALGQKDEAFKHLEKAYDERSPEIVLVLNSRQLDPLRSDPRFPELLRRVYQTE